MKKSRLEIFFLVFLTFLTFRIIGDTAHFYIAPFIEGRSIFFFLVLLSGRISSVAALGFLILFVNSLTGRMDSGRSPLIFRLVFAAVLLISIVYTFAEYTVPYPSAEDLEGFSIFDSIFFIVPFYPLVMFFLFSGTINNRGLFRITRTISVMLLFFLIIMLFFDRGFPLKLTVVLQSELAIPSAVYVPYYLFYLSMNISLLYYGFRYYIDRKHFASGKGRVSTVFTENYGITPREEEVLSLLVEGYSNRRIGEALYISPATVRNHLHNIFEKTGATGRLELVRMCEK